MIHITENSLLRISGGAGRPQGQRVACGQEKPTLGAYHCPRDPHDQGGNWVIVNERGGSMWPIEGIAHVDCPTCRVLIDAALERRDVAALIDQVVR